MGTVTHLRTTSSAWGRRSSRMPAEEALLELITEGGPLATHFESACRAGAIALRDEIPVFREALLMRGHRFATHAEQHEETGEAMFALAYSLLPDSPAASWMRLKERWRSQGFLGVHEATNTREALLALVAGEYSVYDEFVLLAGQGRDSLLPLAQRLHDEIVRLGSPGRCVAKGFSSVVLDLARELVPESLLVAENPEPFDGWDTEWAFEIARKALAYAAFHAGNVPYEQLDLSEVHRAHVQMDAAAEAGDRDSYYAAAKRWASALRRAAERVNREQDQEEVGEEALPSKRVPDAPGRGGGVSA